MVSCETRRRRLVNQFNVDSKDSEVAFKITEASKGRRPRSRLVNARDLT